MTYETYGTSTSTVDEAGESPARHSKIRAGARVVLGLLVLWSLFAGEVI